MSRDRFRPDGRAAKSEKYFLLDFLAARRMFPAMFMRAEAPTRDFIIKRWWKPSTSVPPHLYP